MANRRFDELDELINICEDRIVAAAVEWDFDTVAAEMLSRDHLCDEYRELNRVQYAALAKWQEAMPGEDVGAVIDLLRDLEN